MPQQTVKRFSDRVENYVRYRPDYPREILGLLAREAGLRKTSVIADIGSGTGISARLFLENGNRVFGVEPNDLMRRAAEEYLGDFPNFVSVNGTAENTTLAADSVDFVVAAQAYHWFDGAPTVVEFRRILSDNGHIVLIWNERQLGSTAFLREYEGLLLEFGTDYDQVRHEQITAEVLEQAFCSPFRRAVFQNSQTLDFAGLKGRMLSASYVPAPNHPRFGEMLEKLQMLFTKHEKNGKIQIFYDTNVFYTRK